MAGYRSAACLLQPVKARRADQDRWRPRAPGGPDRRIIAPSPRSTQSRRNLHHAATARLERRLRHSAIPLDYIGSEAGGWVPARHHRGRGAALKDSGRLPVAGHGDGRFPDGRHRVWTAAHYGFPASFSSQQPLFFNDELHQERVAKERSRPVENRWIGQRISGPDIDIAMMARAKARGIADREGVGVAPAMKRESSRA